MMDNDQPVERKSMAAAVRQMLAEMNRQKIPEGVRVAFFPRHAARALIADLRGEGVSARLEKSYHPEYGEDFDELVGWLDQRVRIFVEKEE